MAIKNYGMSKVRSSHGKVSGNRGITGEGKDNQKIFGEQLYCGGFKRARKGFAQKSDGG